VSCTHVAAFSRRASPTRRRKSHADPQNSSKFHENERRPSPFFVPSATAGTLDDNVLMPLAPLFFLVPLWVMSLLSLIQFAGADTGNPGSYTDISRPICARWRSLSASRACSTDHALHQTLGVLGSCIVGRAGRRRSSCRRSLSTSLLANSQGAHTTARG
jgi:hypothetical protein